MLDDSKLKRHIEMYNSLYPKKQYLFQLAFEIYKDVHEFNKETGSPREHYFKEIEEIKLCHLKKVTMRKIYRTVYVFHAKLKDASKMILPFSAYREIANSRLEEEQKYEILQNAEENRYSIKQIVRKIKEMQNNNKGFDQFQEKEFNSLEEFNKYVKTEVSEKDVVKITLIQRR